MTPESAEDELHRLRWYLAELETDIVGYIILETKYDRVGRRYYYSRLNIDMLKNAYDFRSHA